MNTFVTYSVVLPVRPVSEQKLSSSRHSTSLLRNSTSNAGDMTSRLTSLGRRVLSLSQLVSPANATASNFVGPKVSMSPIYSLPPELLDHVFKFLTVFAYNDYFCSFDGWHFRYPQSEDEPKRRDAFRCMQNLILVCKLWYQLGIQYLYFCIPICSSLRIRELLHTMQRCPDVLGYIKNIFILGDLDITHDLPTILPFLPGPRRIKRKHEQIEHQFYRLLSSCSHLQGLTISCRDTLTVKLAESTLSDRSITRSLRRLDICGGLAFDAGSAYSFPSLEVLCLRQRNVDVFHLDLPSMPNLLTLQCLYSFVHTQHSTSGGLNEPFSELPSLQTLELYNSTVYGPLSNYVNEKYDPLSRFPSLSRLHLLGTEEGYLFQRLVSQGHNLDNIHHLVLGSLPDSAEVLRNWTFPDNLTGLTLLHAVVMTHSEGSKPRRNSFFHNVYRCLQHNRQRVGRESTFRSLTIHAPMYRWHTDGRILSQEESGYGEMILNIRKICKLKGIELDLRIDISRPLQNWMAQSANRFILD
ncbi:hypothetical protein C8Q75DRAFT_763760 [Abortiporus biennis]|nr:hypothetical protein C8Q75DRAFT_763760 [Abortiporus biennis]